jgi:protocatechuate 3,4-dioxygenase beta subunit
VAGAEVLLSLADGASSTLTTDTDGRFRFEPERPGLVAIAAITAPGYLPFAPEWGYSPIELMARPGVRVRDVVIYLSPALDYVGVVVAPDGKPVAGAEVRIIDLPAREQELVSIPDRFTTDGKGEFRFHAPDFALFEARASGHGTGRARLDQTALITHRLTLRLAAAGTAGELGSARLAGVVVDGENQPLAGVLVSAAPHSPGPPPVRSSRQEQDLVAAGRTITGADGRFAIEGLDPGAYEVVARDREHTPARDLLTLERGARAEVRLAMTRGALLTGRVRDTGGEPVPAFTVVVFESKSLGRGTVVSTRTFVDGGGAFTVEGLEARDYRLLATAHGHAPSRSVEATAVLPPEKPSAVEIRLPAGATLSGVVRETGGKPIENARVSVEGGLGEGSTPVPFFASAVTDQRGEFALRGLAPGRRSVAAIAGGHHGAVLTGIEVTEDARIGPVEVILAPLAEGEKPTVEMAGIGAALSAVDDALHVDDVLPGGGALAAGLAAGDEIVTIDGRTVVDIGFDAAIQAIRGPVGTTLRLGLRRPANPAALVELEVQRVKIRF